MPGGIFELRQRSYLLVLLGLIDWSNVWVHLGALWLHSVFIPQMLCHKSGFNKLFYCVSHYHFVLWICVVLADTGRKKKNRKKNTSSWYERMCVQRRPRLPVIKLWLDPSRFQSKTFIIAKCRVMWMTDANYFWGKDGKNRIEGGEGNEGNDRIAAEKYPWDRHLKDTERKHVSSVSKRHAVLTLVLVCFLCSIWLCPLELYP